MSTRHLIVAIDHDGVVRLAEYGNFDGYPEGVGLAVLDFVRRLQRSPRNQARFATHLAACVWVAPEVADTVRRLALGDAAEMLDVIVERPLRLTSHLEFAADSLFCEWAYVVDLKRGEFWVYRGFTPASAAPAPQSHFSALAPAPGSAYGVVHPVAHWPLAKLPRKPDFIKACTAGAHD